MPAIVAAYTASPCHTSWDEALESIFYEGLEAISGADGFEIPFSGTLHPHDEAWLLRRLPSGWRHVVTCLPGTMARLAAAPRFGLASEDPAGRAAALAFAREARTAVVRLNDATGAASVLAVELHSAPGEQSSASALAASLAELAELDWQGAALVIEHCDARGAAHPPQKGFLGLDGELAAIAASGAPIGISINWARSVLETRRPETAAAHIARAQEAGRLAGVMFSGCSGVADQPYGAWQDNHMPHAPAPGLAWGVAGSLLTEAAIGDAVSTVRGPAFVGVKLGARPIDMPLMQRIGMIQELMRLVMAAQSRAFES